MKEKIAQIEQLLVSELAGCEQLQALDALRVKVLGKKGELTALLRGMGQLSPEERPAAGQMINEAREKFTAMLEDRQALLKKMEQEAALKREAEIAHRFGCMELLDGHARSATIRVEK